MAKLTQNDVVLMLMQERGSITQRDAFDEGIYRLASRICDLRREGHNIKVDYETVSTRWGRTQIARYSLGEND